jgi:hypothetical protein
MAIESMMPSGMGSSYGPFWDAIFHKVFMFGIGMIVMNILIILALVWIGTRIK